MKHWMTTKITTWMTPKPTPKRIALFSLIFTMIFFGCDSKTEDKQEDFSKPTQSIDLDQIKERGTLKVLLSYSSTSYFLYRGETMGFEYELLERLAKELDLELDIVVVNDLDSVFDYLNSGKADLIAHGLTITSDRKQKANFTDYLYLTSQVLVQKKPDDWRKLSWAHIQKSLIHDVIDLIDDTVSVRENTSYEKRLRNLSKELGEPIHINVLDGTLSTEEILKMVAEGEIKYTVADKNLAKVSKVYYPILDISVPLSLSQRIAWATRKSSPQLLAAINQWIKKEKKEADYYVIYNKYFKNKRDFKKRFRSDYMSLNGNQISQYDALIKKYSQAINWDWRLVAALVYQESQFNLKAKSWAGAQGLMQIMPKTAKSLGITDITDPEQSIRGGTMYLKQLYDKFDDINDSIQRIKFTMASYNCGIYHVADARYLAEQNDLDPNKWDENVEKMILALSYPRSYNSPGVKYGYVRGIEPVQYVDHIFKRYEDYVNFID